MGALKLCLWAAGIVCLASGIGIFLPIESWNSIAEIFGVEPLLDTPFMRYMLDLMCATYAAIGLYFIMLALRPMKYGVLVPFSGLLSALLGAVCIITGNRAGMPAKWFLADGLTALFLGILILLSWRRAKKAARMSAQPAK